MPRAQRQLLQHDHRRADIDHPIELNDIAIEHADAAVGHETAHRFRLVGAVDGVFAAAQHQRRLAHRILRGAAGNDVGQIRLVALDLSGWRPGRLYVLAGDGGGAGPGLAGFADSDRIAYRVPLLVNEIEPALGGFYDDGAGRVAVEGDDLARRRITRRRNC